MSREGWVAELGVDSIEVEGCEWIQARGLGVTEGGDKDGVGWPS